MRLCRFNENRLGVVEGDKVLDVSAALEVLPLIRWPIPIGDPLISNLTTIRKTVDRIKANSKTHNVADIALHSPICNPSKIMAAPANYRKHVEQDTLDPGVDQNVHRKALEGVERPTEKFGLFLKATSAVSGPAEGVCIVFPERRSDHEVELAVVIGKRGHSISQKDAMNHVAGYCIGLDMTVRGGEDRSFRKSPDTYAVLGPWFVTADEIPNPEDLTLSLSVNGELRQRSSTGAMTMNIEELIEFASRNYTLFPGDIIMTGTPEGVGPVGPGDVMAVSCQGIGEMTLNVRGR